MQYYHKLILRYIIALIIRPTIFHWIFLPLTILPTFLILRLLQFPALLRYEYNSIYLNNTIYSFVPACVAAFAYYLLILLILLTKDISFKKSLYMFLIGSLLILVMNVIRVVILIIVLDKFGYSWFNVIHLTFWDFVSTLYVFFVWLF